MDHAAHSVLGRANRISVSANLETGGKLFAGSNGRYGATAPLKGTDQGFNMAPVPVPQGTTETGNYHTHGDYSRAGPNGEAIGTSNPAQDAFNSDH